jgi:hypothetical protein
MRNDHTVALVLLASVALPISHARSDQYPTLNVAPLCHALTDKSSLMEGLGNVSFDDCMKAEQTDRETMIKQWSTFSADDRTHCIAEATMGGESSYTDLLTCLEMARDVRALRTGTEPQQTEPPPRRKPRGTGPMGHSVAKVAVNLP